MSFLGFKLQALQLEQRATLGPFLRQHAIPLSGYTFGSLAAWNSTFDYRLAFVEPTLALISYVLAPDTSRYLMQPVGELSARALSQIVEEAARLPYRLKMSGVTESFLKSHEELLRYFSVHEERDGANYVYGAADLAELKGKKYSAKRNHIAQAERAYSWTVQPLSAAEREDCFQVVRDAQAEDLGPVDRNRRLEQAALDYTLQHWEEMEHQGILVRVEGRPVAFSIFEPLTKNTAVIHYERALRAFKGLYQVVNREAARVIQAQGFELINREEDIGDEGLRKAKLSYSPRELVKSFTLTFQ